MRIGFDAHYIGARVLGRETYLANLIDRLAHQDFENEYVLYVSEPQAMALGPHIGGRFELRILPSRLTIIQRAILLPRRLRRDGIEVFYLHTLGVPFYRGRTVLAVHGIRELSFAPPEHRLMQRVLLPWSLESATRVIANSEFTRQEILSGYGLPAERVRVVHGGVDPHIFHPAPAHPVPSPEPAGHAGHPDAGDAEPGRLEPSLAYVLYVGAIEPRKNLARLLAAFARARPRLPPGFALAIAGIPRGREGGRHEASLRSLCGHLGIAEAVRWLGYVSPGQAAALMRGARLFAFPSLHESFGLPPLEAMACGTPVLASRVGAMPEVLGESPLWCDPLDVPGVTEALVRLVHDSDLRACLVERGRAQAARFTWEATAERTLEVFREASANGA